VKPNIKDGDITLNNSQIIEYIELQMNFLEAEIVRSEKMMKVMYAAGIDQGKLVQSVSLLHKQSN